MGERRLNTKELADLLGISEKTIRNKRSDGSWPIKALKIGGSVRWRLSDVERLMASGDDAAGQGRP